MATQVQNRRGTTAEHSTFTGAVGEVTIDTDKDTAVVHDGATAGGRPLLREDQSNLPTSAPTNGVYLPSANNVAISTNGTGRLSIDSNGNVAVDTNTLYVDAVNNRVAVGTTSPDALLTVNGIGAFGAGAVTTPSIAATGDLNTGFWFPTADTIAASTGGTERLRVTSDGYLRLAANGIQFNGDTATANALDDYEEGTWTPTAAQGFTSPIYGASTAGIYTKVGNIVRIHGRLVLTGGTATASTIRIGGLPFTCQNTASQYVTCAYYLNAGAGTVGNALKPLVLPGQIFIEVFLQNNTNVTGVAGTTLGNTMDVLFSATYQV